MLTLDVHKLLKAFIFKIFINIARKMSILILLLRKTSFVFCVRRFLNKNDVRINILYL